MRSDGTTTSSSRSTEQAQSRSALFFSHAFRPFFLASGVYAVLALAAWLAWISIHAIGAVPAFMTVAEPLHLWHAHEMIYGFAAAAAGGFLLTAVPSWTGAKHSKGRTLAFMFALWCCGRVAMWGTAVLPPVLTTVLDLTFLPILGLAAARQLAVQPALRNVVFLSLIGALVAGNVLYHLGRMDMLEDGMSLGVRFGLATFVIMIMVIGGRVIPGFTTNALRREDIEDEQQLPASRTVVNMASLVLSVAALTGFVLKLQADVVGVLAAAAALANTVRLAGWRGLATLSSPILWVLHLGYAWIIVGFAILAASLLAGWASEAAALHAFGTGAAGTMILAIMTRASLGHTGRGLVVSGPIVTAYGLVSVAALLRCFGPAALPQYFNEIMLGAGAAWIAAYVLFTVVFTPILLGPRVARNR
ncbi:MAG: NnrS family protein [Hyphomicrobiaceae bacterium]|nr:NnrS family protein [Hyphomicrobiaceae bacterium]